MSSFQTSEFLLSHQILTLDNGLRAIENCKTFDTENWKLRPATASDRTRVCDFVVDVHLEATGYNEEAREQQRLELPDDFPELFSDEVWINTISLLCFSSRDVDADERPLLIGCIGMRHHSNETAEIGYFYVHNKYRRLGIGRSLLKLSLSWLKRISSAALFPYSYKKIVLITLLDILDAAIKLYKSEGFVVQEEKQSKFYTGLIMALDIARYGSKIIELAKYQISEVELTRAAYASEFSMDELSCEHMIVLESMSVTGEWSAAQICSAINFTVQIWKNAAVQIWLPRQAFFFTTRLRSSTI
jgi:ribosomal protein S18 acetylase RimI-like enzyme